LTTKHDKQKPDAEQLGFSHRGLVSTQTHAGDQHRPALHITFKHPLRFRSKEK